MGLPAPAAIGASRIVLHLAAHIWPLGPKSPKLGVHAVIEPDGYRTYSKLDLSAPRAVSARVRQWCRPAFPEPQIVAACGNSRLRPIMGAWAPSHVIGC